MNRYTLKRKIIRAGFITLIAPVMLIASCGGEGGPSSSSASGGSHRAGENCISCHASKWKYAGTVYTDVGGAQTVSSGVKVVITQNNGEVIEVTTDTSGNFYTNSGDPGAGYSATVQGNSVGMVTRPTSGGCSTGGCHDASARPRIYVN